MNKFAKRYRPAELGKIIANGLNEYSRQEWDIAAKDPLTPQNAIDSRVAELLKTRQGSSTVYYQIEELIQLLLRTHQGDVNTVRQAVAWDTFELAAITLVDQQTPIDAWKEALQVILSAVKKDQSPLTESLFSQIWRDARLTPHIDWLLSFCNPASDKALFQAIRRHVHHPKVFQKSLQHALSVLPKWIHHVNHDIYHIHEALAAQPESIREWIQALCMYPQHDSQSLATSLIILNGLTHHLTGEESCSIAQALLSHQEHIPRHQLQYNGLAKTFLEILCLANCSWDTILSSRVLTENLFSPPLHSEALACRLRALSQQEQMILLQQVCQNGSIIQLSTLLDSGIDVTNDSYRDILAVEDVGFLVSLLHTKQDLPTWVIEELSIHSSIEIRSAVATHPISTEVSERILSHVRKTIQSERRTNHFERSSAFTMLTSLDDFISLSTEHGYDLFAFKHETSTRAFTKTLIGTAHPDECAFIHQGQCASTVTAISALQSVFTNNRGKLDRHQYLQALKAINEGVFQCSPAAGQSGLAVDAITLREAWSFFSQKEIIFILTQNKKDEARDIFRMTASITLNDDPAESNRQRGLIRRWIDKNEEYGAELHRYLTEKSLRENKGAHHRTFALDRISDDWIAENIKLPDFISGMCLPRNTLELARLGRRQRHCVGTQFYADRCADGSNIIFSLTTGRGADQEFTFQFSRSGNLLQAKGFANSSVDHALQKIASEVAHVLLNEIERQSNEGLALAA